MLKWFKVKIEEEKVTELISIKELSENLLPRRGVLAIKMILFSGNAIHKAHSSAIFEFYF